TIVPSASFAMNAGSVYSPSACPRSQGSSSGRRERKRGNLRLEEPALMTRIASAMVSAHHAPAAGSPRFRHQGRHGAGGESSDDGVGAAGGGDGALRPEGD